jgi:hypothetical protein
MKALTQDSRSQAIETRTFRIGSRSCNFAATFSNLVLRFVKTNQFCEMFELEELNKRHILERLLYVSTTSVNIVNFFKV